MGFEAQLSYRLPSPPCGPSGASNSAMGGMSASSFSARTVANPSAAASASSMMADAAAEEFATVLAEKLEVDIPPIAEFDAPEGPQGGMVACRKIGPRSPCNRLVFIVIILCNRIL